ncbi:MAG TPA: class I SAM-dependent methyltransferase [Burkholderiales bacterium]
MSTVLNAATDIGRDAYMLTSPEGMVLVHELDSGRRAINVEPRPGFTLSRRHWETGYPMELIRAIHRCKGLYLCDEIMREEDPDYVERYLRHEVLGYVEAEQFRGKRVLDFRCGSGASTMVLGRMLPPCELIGVEMDDRLLGIARMRATLFRRDGVRFLRSPAPDSFPDGEGEFDYVMFSAVFEHLLPAERAMLLTLIWKHIRPGGILFLNQTPHRYSPVEMHTTGLPLINYLPAGLAWRLATRLSTHVRPDDDWPTLLRAGIRGGTVREILSILSTSGTPQLLAPRKEFGDQIDLWHGKLSRRHAVFKRGIWAALKVLKFSSGVQLTPEIAIAIRKAS